jgi:hypothetical protein
MPTLTHLAALQVCILSHFLPHVPQCLGSVAMSTQVPLHKLRFIAQVVVHWPPEQLGLAARHTLPHCPQFLTSVVRSRHWPSQAVSAAVHVTPHVPALQVAVPFAGAAQTVEHEPQ